MLKQAVGTSILIFLCAHGCTEDQGDLVAADASTPAVDAVDTSMLPYAREIIAFSAGAGAGFGQNDLPEVVLGPPDGKGTGQASLDVLSLGQGGQIVLGFGDKSIVDGEGPDFVVFENPFWVGGDSSQPFAELGEVAVSMDGISWTVFPCDTGGDGAGRFPGCAGWSPTLQYDAFTNLPIDLSVSGGDGFDLADLGISEARFVRVTDLSTDGEMPSAGFDLDAVGLVNWN